MLQATCLTELSSCIGWEKLVVEATLWLMALPMLKRYLNLERSFRNNLAFFFTMGLSSCYLCPSGASSTELDTLDAF